MSHKGWQSTATVGGQSYVGDGRSDPERSMFSAARAALRGLGQPFEPEQLSNDQAQTNLEMVCRARGWRPPKYSTKRCKYTPQHSGGRGRRKPAQQDQRLYYAEVTIGAERFSGDATYGTEPAMVAAARVALEEKGQSLGLSSRASSDPIEALVRFCKSQGLSEPDYSLSFGRNEVLGESLLDSPHTDWISTLDNVLKRFQSQESELGLEVNYHDDGQMTGPGFDWIVGCSVGIRRRGTSKRFIGTGTTKQKAKEVAAKDAYEWLSKRLHRDVSDYTVLSELNAAEIHLACQNALRQVCHNLVEPMHDEVFAAILITHSGGRDEIVSIGSGTGFNYRHIKNEEAVLDCHAEVLAHRGLETFLFNQIETAQDDKCILQLSEIAGKGKYQVKEGVHFHLFVNKAPCGDAFVPLKGKHAGRLRYRKDDGEGNVLEVPLGKENQHKVCCSAKIALWNVVGLQGALLANLLTHPIYLRTIFVKGADNGEKEGTVCEASLKRAFFGRLQGLRDLPDGYKVNEPAIVVLPSDGVASGGSDSQKHTAFCWAAGCMKEEMIETTSGRREKGDLDVSRRSFARMWASLFPHDERKYQEVKLAADKYQKAKKKCKEYFGSKWI